MVVDVQLNEIKFAVWQPGEVVDLFSMDLTVGSRGDKGSHDYSVRGGERYFRHLAYISRGFEFSDEVVCATRSYSNVVSKRIRVGDGRFKLRSGDLPVCVEKTL